MPIVVLVTASFKHAEPLAQVLLKEHTCACINILKGVNSLFWWKGKIVDEKEALLIIKTKQSAYRKLKKTIKLNHPYSVPEIIALEMDKIDGQYRKWLDKETYA